MRRPAGPGATGVAINTHSTHFRVRLVLCLAAMLPASAAISLMGVPAWAQSGALARIQAEQVARDAAIAAAKNRGKAAAQSSVKAQAEAQAKAEAEARAAAAREAKAIEIAMLAKINPPRVKPRFDAQPPAKFETSAGTSPTERMGVDVAKLPAVPQSVDWTDGVPGLLAEADAARYRVIFQLQESGDFRGADDIIAQLRDRALMGHVLAHRFLTPHYRTSYAELRDWLADYGDHPDAKRLYALALKRQPKGAGAPKAPSAPDVAVPTSVGINVQAYDRQAFESKTFAAQKKLNAAEKRDYEKLMDKLDWTLRKSTPVAFRKLLTEDKARQLLHPVEYDRQSGRLAQSYYAAGQDEQTIFWGELATKRSGQYLPEIHWTTGLAYWRQGKLDLAAKHFEAVARSEYASRWLLSAGAFWAGRAHVRMRHHKDFTRLMEKAGESPRTFYGLLARRLLNKDADFNWAPPPLDNAALAELTEAPGGKRAVLLLQVGLEERAERELRALSGRTSPGLNEAMLALAERARMPSLAMRLGNMMVRNGQPITDTIAYPAPLLAPADGELIDRELILALARQESGFNPNARSPAGARGLMQIMPATARFIARDGNYAGQVYNRLYEADINVMLGQRYIDILMKEPAINGDLFRMVVAWNAGPGNLAKWMKSVKHNDDPLLFIESIPSPETRNFAERVMTNYWVYRQRFDLPVNSLDSVAAGRWPVYVADTQHPVEVAQDERYRAENADAR